MSDVKLKWLSHSCFEIKGEKSVLIDPFISGNPAAQVMVDEMNPDIIAVTHGHSDHLGDALNIAKNTGCRVVAIHEISKYLKSKGVQAEGMNIGGIIEIDGIELAMTDALHSSSIDEADSNFDGGSAAGFVIKMEGTSVYHAGDTGLFTDMELIGRLYEPDVAIVPIGGRYTMGPKEAAMAVDMIKPEIAIPMHYNTFDVIKQNPNDFARYVKDICDSKVMIMDIGGTIEL